MLSFGTNANHQVKRLLQFLFVAHLGASLAPLLATASARCFPLSAACVFRTSRSYSRLRGLVQFLSRVKPFRRKTRGARVVATRARLQVVRRLQGSRTMHPQRLGMSRYFASGRAVLSDEGPSAGPGQKDSVHTYSELDT